MTKRKLKNTNFKGERNSLKYHLTQTWGNITAAFAIHICWRELSPKPSIHLTVMNEGRICQKEDSVFGCEPAANTSLHSAFFTPHVWQMNPMFGCQNIKPTRMANKSIHEHVDQEWAGYNLEAENALEPLTPCQGTT